MRVPSILLKPWVAHLSWHEEENQVDPSAMTSKIMIDVIMMILT